MGSWMGPPPGMSCPQDVVSLTSIASLLFPGKAKMCSNLERPSGAGGSGHPSNEWGGDFNGHQELPSLSPTFEEPIDKERKSTELAAVANNFALKDDFEAAVKFYSEAIYLKSTDFRFYCNRSYCFENLKDYDKAFEDAEAAIKLNSYRPKPYFRKGRALVGLKRYEEAEETFKHVLKLDTDCEATKNELYQLRYLACRDIGFDVDAALLAAKRCSCISDALDFILNIELLTLKCAEGGGGNDPQAMDTSLSSDPLGTSSAHFSAAIGSRFGKYKLKVESQAKSSAWLQSIGSSSEQRSPEGSSLDGNINMTTNKEYRPRAEPRTVPALNEGPTNLFGYKGLWVGNISPTCSLLMLRALFSRYGKVLWAKVLKDKFCAFISFENSNSPRAAIADLFESCVEGISNEWRPLKFRYIPTSDQPELNYARPVQPRNSNNECYFWRTTGCNASEKCKLLHISICKGIDYQPWMKKL